MIIDSLNGGSNGPETISSVAVCVCSRTNLKLNGLLFQWETNCPKREYWQTSYKESLNAHFVSNGAFEPGSLAPT